MSVRRFTDRVDAGRQLAARLSEYADRPDTVVLGLPRGGVVVAAQVARALRAPLDVYLVRKLGVPGHEELAMGAIAEGGVRVLDRSLIETLGVPEALVERTAVRERLELDRREGLYRGSRPRPPLSGRTVIVVDDGLATGATMEAAVKAIRQHHPSTIVVAVPVGAPETCHRLRSIADVVISVETPEDLRAVGLWYDDFSQTEDQEVRQLVADSSESSVLASRTSEGADRANGTAPRDVLHLIQERARLLDGSDGDEEWFLDEIGTARIVLLGEATHGTHEFYQLRARLTRKLIAERGFTAVAVEADWPDAFRVNRYVRGLGSHESAVDALGDFRRFPAWMWRNTEVVEFIGWLHQHNDRITPDQRAGFYGLDLYSLHASMRAVVTFLDKVDPASAARARRRYACFDRFGEEPEHYAHAAGLGLEPSCERDVLSQLLELRRRAVDYARLDGRLATDDLFAAEQNARVVRNAEAYYRTMLGGHIESWNLRDRHMTETLTDLVSHLSAHRQARVVVWAHNSHLGDARATEMGERGELNVGQLVREQFGGDVVSLGFTTHSGTVTAASDWDGPARRRRVRPSLSTSYEHLFHETTLPQFVLPLRTDPELAAALGTRRLERAIGVLYRPDTERRSHYFHARLSAQFDYLVHVDHTRALEPLERTSHWETGETADTYPSGL